MWIWHYYQLLKNHKNKVSFWLAAVTFLLGAAFIAIELHEFIQLIQEGNSLDKKRLFIFIFYSCWSAWTPRTVGLLWMIVMIVQVSLHGVTCPYFSSSCGV